LVVYPLIGYLALGVGLYVRQTELLFPAPRDFERLTPANLRMRYDDLRIPTQATGWIHAWWIPGEDAPRKTILMFHGNGYVLEESLEEVTELHKIGTNLLLVDYRGYGSSSRVTPSEATVNEDADAALAWLTGRRQVAEGDVFVLGRSIGTGPATYLAAAHPALAGLILESPFSSIEDAAKEVWPSRIYPVHLLLRTHFDNLSRIGRVRAPVLIVVGTADTLTPAWMAGRLYERANEPKQLYLVRGAEHNDLVDVGGEALREVLRRFVRLER
jgi:fermentation-respiration switch protein FrsA (DUF1100 family)